MRVCVWFSGQKVTTVDYFVIETEDSIEQPEILLDRRGSNVLKEDNLTTFSEGVKEFGADYGGYGPQGYLAPVCIIILHPNI